MTRNPNATGIGPLMLAAALLVAAWLVVLPWVGELPGVEDHIKYMRQKRIHPDAMFYTELEELPRLR
jgi:hypothetical protein